MPRGHNDTRTDIVGRFPLVPRARPPARTLHHRVDEVRTLAHTARSGDTFTQLTAAAEACNKAALIASDCGLHDLAQQLCHRQYDLYTGAMPLPARTAKLALQPLVNLARLRARTGKPHAAYDLLQTLFTAVSTSSTATIDGTEHDFATIVSEPTDRRDLQRFLWTVLIADGTRALLQAHRWTDVLTHLEHHNAVGHRMLDGRQAAILAHTMLGHHDEATALLNASVTPSLWEQAVTATLRVFCLHDANRPDPAATATMVTAYRRLRAAPTPALFRTRLGVCVLDMTPSVGGSDAAAEIARTLIDGAAASADAQSAVTIRAHPTCRSYMNAEQSQQIDLIVAASGLGSGAVSTALFENLQGSVTTAEQSLRHLLAGGVPDTHT